MPKTRERIEAFLRESCTPSGYKYTLVMVSAAKRMLAQKIPAEFRLKYLEHLDRMTDRDSLWLTADMIAAVEPACDKAYEIMREAQKLPDGEFLDVYA